MSKDLFYDLSRAADDLTAQLEQVQSVLQILNEGLEDEVRFLGKSNDGYAKYFVGRYDLYRGLLDMTVISLYDYRKEFSDQYKKLWEAYQKQKQAS